MPQKFSLVQLTDLIRSKKAALEGLGKEAFDDYSRDISQKFMPMLADLNRNLRAGTFGAKGSPAYEAQIRKVVSGQLLAGLQSLLQMMHETRRATGYAAIKACAPGNAHGLFNGMEEKLKEASQGADSMILAVRTANFVNNLYKMLELMYQLPQSAGYQMGTPAQAMDPAARKQLTSAIAASDLLKYVGILANIQFGGKQVFARMLDRIASDLEAQGHKDLAEKVDIVSNSLEAEASGVSDEDIRKHAASAADHIATAAAKIYEGFRASGLQGHTTFAALVTDLLHPRQPLDQFVPAALLVAADKGGLATGELLEALKDPQTLAEEMNRVDANPTAQNLYPTTGA